MRSWIRTALWLGAVLPAGAALAATENKIELQGTPRPLERPAVDNSDAAAPIQLASATTLRPVARTNVATAAEKALVTAGETSGS
ncbi:MAG: lytic murein transglycosylase, partial [Tritonibacter mobilis]|nr:lytic murein transglycosylase [Tritonibacter mobilis]